MHAISVRLHSLARSDYGCSTRMDAFKLHCRGAGDGVFALLHLPLSGSGSSLRLILLAVCNLRMRRSARCHAGARGLLANPLVSTSNKRLSLVSDTDFCAQ